MITFVRDVVQTCEHKWFFLHDFSSSILKNRIKTELS
jgi:hypothetical protein